MIFAWDFALKSNFVKLGLALTAIGSFAFAFAQEKLAQYIPSLQLTASNPSCLKQFYKSAPPFLAKESLSKNNYPLCYNGFTVMYSGVSKTPLWSAEYLNPERLSQKIKREDSFHPEERIAAGHRAELSDYRGSGYDRGHMSPNGDMPDKKSQHDSFSLANMVPQAPKNNQQVWRELEEATRAIVNKHKHEVYVVTGPVFSGKKLKTIGNGVIVPTAVFKAVYIPKEGVVGAYLAPNDSSLHVNLISVCELEDLVGMNIFPELTDEQKRNVYRLPLTAAQVKTNKKIDYLQWDGKSQCAVDVSSEQILATQKQFKSQKMTSASQETLPKIDSDTQDALVKQLVQALLQYILQFVK